MTTVSPFLQTYVFAGLVMSTGRLTGGVSAYCKEGARVLADSLGVGALTLSRRLILAPTLSDVGVNPPPDPSEYDRFTTLLAAELSALT